MPKRRIPKKEINLEQQIEAFGNLAEVSPSPIDFEQLSLDDLAKQYREIDRQSHLLKGRIILAARAKFNSDKQFGIWLSDKLSDLNQKQAHRLACLAEFFDEQSNFSMTGISLSACYELSAPKNRSFAKDVYFEIAGRGLSLAEVREKLSNKFNALEQQKLITSNPLQFEAATTKSALDVTPRETEISAINSTESTALAVFKRDEEIVKLINVTLAGLENTEKLAFLNDCIAIISNEKHD